LAAKVPAFGARPQFASINDGGTHSKAIAKTRQRKAARGAPGAAPRRARPRRLDLGLAPIIHPLSQVYPKSTQRI
jgi:hypothetical protein